MFKTEFKSKEELETYLQGAFDALEAFAVWRDGKQWVNDMRTLGETKEIILRETGFTEKENINE